MSHSRLSDAIVVGGGPAGAACAASLARAGVDVMLIHDERRGGWPGESLPPGSTGVITSIFGPVLDEARGHRITAGIRAAWGSRDLVETDYLRDPSDDAWVLDRARFDVDARAAAASHGARILLGRAQTPERNGSNWQVPLTSGETLTARFIVDATGRSAAVARRLGMRSRRRDHLVALVAIGRADGAARTGTMVESVENGWWYATVIGERAIVAFLTDADLLPKPDEHSAFWRAALASTQHVRRIATALPDPELHRADTAFGEPAYGPGWVAVGDAAAAWDPLSSQGLLAGILLAAQAAQAFVHGDMREWGESLRMLVEDTWGLQALYYGEETRWPDAPFWQRRHAWLT
jgi:flavin-dependent dehydrogenase